MGPLTWLIAALLSIQGGGLGSNLSSIGSLTPGDGNFIVGDGSTWVTESGAVARASMGVSIGSDVQAYDDTLQSIAANTGSAADRGIYFTALDTAAEFTLTAFGRSLVDDADAAAGRATLDAQQADADLDAVAGLAATGLIARTGAGTAAARTITGTANQITVADGDGVAGNPTLSLPQDIHTGASPTFAGLTTTGARTVGTTAITNADTPYSVVATDHVILCNSSGGAVTINLPASTDGRVILAKNTVAGGGGCTLDGSGAETIDGAATYALDVDYEAVILVGDGTGWHTF